MKAIALIISVIALQCSACNNNPDANIVSCPSAAENKLNEYNDAGITDPVNSFRLPYNFVKKGRFCIVLYGKKSDEQIREADQKLSSGIDKTTTDYYFVDLSQVSEEEKEIIKIDFPDLEGIYAISASGNMIQKSTNPNSEDISAILKRISELNRLYGLNDISQVDFSAFNKPLVKQNEETVKKNFFKIGTYNNVIVPDDFCEKGKISVIIFSTPGCIPCDKLKKALLEDNSLEPEKVDFYFVNHAYDDQQTLHPWKEDVTKTKALKIYAMEGMMLYPTVWMVSPTGTISEIVDGEKTGGLTLYEYTVKWIQSINNSGTMAVLPKKAEKADPPKTNPGAKNNEKPKKADTKIPAISIKEIQISSNLVKLICENAENMEGSTVEVEIVNHKGAEIVKFNSVLNEASKNTLHAISLSAVFGLKKKTSYRLSLIISSGNRKIFSVSNREFTTDKSSSSVITF